LCVKVCSKFETQGNRGDYILALAARAHAALNNKLEVTTNDIKEMGERDLAKQQFGSVIELCDRVKWQRFRNYAQNALAEIAIEEGDLETAEDLILDGLSFAEICGEKRRIALYQSTKLYARLASQVPKADEKFSDYILSAQQYATQASEVFQEEWMVVERERWCFRSVVMLKNYFNGVVDT
jgi:hypothetical protein